MLYAMRFLVAALLLVGCAHAAPPAGPTAEEIEAQRDAQRWDEFCRNPPTTGDWQDWCARRAQQRQLEVSQQILQTEQGAAAEQRVENGRAERHRRFEHSQAVWNASQAPFKGDR